jgi:hypothetical protein
MTTSTTTTGIPLHDLTHEGVRLAAISHGACVRPIMQRLVDTDTGEDQLIPIACGSTRDRQCPTCADRNRKLRMAQCREGWHLAEDPLPEPPPYDDSDEENDGDQGDDDEPSRRVRSTRRRQDAPDLPRLPVEHRSVGRTFVGNNGQVYRPSMFLTCTLCSYGPVRIDGTPLNPQRYDYRRAALDAMHFPKLVDRFWQNLRRCAGYKVQYFAAIEAQKRLAPHLHAAIRGTIPRAVFKQVVAATYHQIWWPHFDEPIYTDRPPEWDYSIEQYVDPDTSTPLQTWQQALDRIDDDPDATPAHVLRFGEQTDSQGLLPGTKTCDKRIAYLTKYLTKSIADTYGDEDTTTPAQKAHIDRLHAEVRWLPCTPRCANWLRFGIQPDEAEPGLVPGECDHKMHRRENLGCGGRRVLVSRYWTGKTLTDHKADRRTVVAQALQEAGIDMPDADRCSATATSEDGSGEPRFQWEPVDPTETDMRTYRDVILAAIAERQRWREQYEAAKARAGPGPDNHSAIQSSHDSHDKEGSNPCDDC